jgi:hypothetical protein
MIACAAYRSGEKLHSEYYGEDADYTRKGGVILTDILLPPHAPPEYADRETLWNAVENAERHPKAQLAYSFDIALQNEFSLEENIALARQFLLEQFVSRGMIVDFAIHDPDKKGGIPNPHIHFLCPIRPLKENGEWDAKQHREYVLDENGERVRDDAGHDVFNAVPTTDWGRPETLEYWRQAWAELCNAKFAERGLDCRIDHRSYERQGVEQLPTVHEGPAVRQMEAKGIRTDKGDLNRWIRKTNELLRKIKTKISELIDWLKAVDEELSNAHSPSLTEVLGDFYQAQNAGAWSDKAKVGNLKRYAADIAFLETKGVTTVDDLHDFVSNTSDEYHSLNTSLKGKETRMKELKTLLRLAADYSRLKPIVDAIPAKGGFGKKHEKYVAEHDSEISQFYAVRRKLDNAVSDKKLTVKAWQAEFDQLSQEYAAESAKLKPMWDDLKKLNDLQYKVDNTLHDQQRSPQKQKNYEQEI